MQTDVANGTGSKPNDIEFLKVLLTTFFMCFFLYVIGKASIFCLYHIFIQIVDHFSFRSVIFSLTSGIKNLELNVNKPPIYLASPRFL